MSTPKADDRRFIAHLKRLVPRDQGSGSRESGSRAALAALRRGLGKQVGEAPEMYPYVVPALPDVDEQQERTFYLVAALFGLHPRDVPTDDGRGVNLGASLSRLAGESESGGVERRFVALLNASRPDLPEHLRHAVSLLKSKDRPLDWVQLLRDVRDWEHPERPVQRAWARSYWAGATHEESAAAAGLDAAINEEATGEAEAAHNRTPDDDVMALKG